MARQYIIDYDHNAAGRRIGLTEEESLGVFKHPKFDAIVAEFEMMQDPKQVETKVGLLTKIKKLYCTTQKASDKLSAMRLMSDLLEGLKPKEQKDRTLIAPIFNLTMETKPHEPKLKVALPAIKGISD